MPAPISLAINNSQQITIENESLGIPSLPEIECSSDEESTTSSIMSHSEVSDPEQQQFISEREIIEGNNNTNHKKIATTEISTTTFTIDNKNYIEPVSQTLQQQQQQQQQHPKTPPVFALPSKFIKHVLLFFFVLDFFLKYQGNST